MYCLLDKTLIIKLKQAKLLQVFAIFFNAFFILQVATIPNAK